MAAFYLQHRYSDDLDFFTEDPQAVLRVPAVMKEVAAQLGIGVSFTRTLEHFLECFLVSAAGERLEMDFALDSPYRLEPKDFVDVYFIHHERFPLDELFPRAKQKHVRMDPYWLAQAFSRITEVKVLPRMIKAVTLEQLSEFFTKQIPRLMQSPKIS